MGRSTLDDHTRSGSRAAILLCAAAALLSLAGCGPAATGVPEGASGPVRVLGAWSGDELERFLSVLAPFEAATGVTVEYQSTRDLRGVIARSIEAGDPPDLAGLEGPGHLAQLARSGALQDISAAMDDRPYRTSVAPTFVDLGSVDGRLVGVFVKATVKGLLWYNPKVFRGVVPTEFEDLQLLAQSKLSAETHQWCVGLESGEASGWPGTDWIESLLLHESGLEAYDRWVSGQLPWASPEVRRAFVAYGRVVADGAAHGSPEDVLAISFDVAGAPLFAEPPGCLFLHQGSFMPVFFEADGLTAGEDFDFFPFPRMGGPDRGAVLGAGDLMGLLTDDPRAARLLEYLVGAEAQEAWVQQGGALSVNQAVKGYPNEVVRREAEYLASAPHFRFDGSDLMSPELNAAFWKAILDITAEPQRLDEVLGRLDRIRAGGG